MSTMWVRPLAEIVRDPVTKQPLPREGAEVPRESYWLRRLRDGDVELAERPELPKAEE